MWTDTVPDPQAVYDDFAGRSPLARVAGPDEIAAAYAFLMSSSNTTGTILTSDAGTGAGLSCPAASEPASVRDKS
jgi:NAD(P)-dependent dehydrogenase (short-subunit alcohol dehydrogenase family)